MHTAQRQYKLGSGRSAHRPTGAREVMRWPACPARAPRVAARALAVPILGVRRIHPGAVLVWLKVDLGQPEIAAVLDEDSAVFDAPAANARRPFSQIVRKGA